MQNYNEKKIAGLILAIDFRKAFDSINHGYIQAVLRKLNFGNDICDWVKLFFNEGRILMDGHLTDKITLEQGMPQGHIISPFIFSCVQQSWAQLRKCNSSVCPPSVCPLYPFAQK